MANNTGPAINMNDAPEPPSGQRTNHLIYLDSIRGLAAMYVVVFHMGMATGMDHYVRLWGWLGQGHWAVNAFIVLSGHCLMLPVLRNDLALRGGVKSFLLRRAGRILPPYYFAFATTLIFCFLLNANLAPPDIAKRLSATSAPGVLAHLLLVHDISSAFIYQAAPPFWSVAVEWRIYFAFPVLIFLWRRFGALATTVISIVTSLILSGLLSLIWVKNHSVMGHPYMITGIMPQYLGLFTVGMLSAHVSSNSALLSSRSFVKHVTVSLATAILVVAYSPYIIVKGHVLPPAITDHFVGYIVVALLVLVSTSPVAKTALSWKPLVFVGGFSYSIYLIHALVIYSLQTYVIGVLMPAQTPATGFLFMLVFGIPAVFVISYIMYRLVELPSMRSTRRIPFSGSGVSATQPGT